jgi:hypothetical protein
MFVYTRKYTNVYFRVYICVGGSPEVHGYIWPTEQEAVFRYLRYELFVSAHETVSKILPGEVCDAERRVSVELVDEHELFCCFCLVREEGKERGKKQKTKTKKKKRERSHVAPNSCEDVHSPGRIS